MKIFFISFLLFLTFAISFNFYVDKNFYWYRGWELSKFTINDKECISLSSEISDGHDRQLQKQIRKNYDHYDRVAMGSSRGAYADFSFFPNEKYYNFAVSVGLLEDYISTWQELKNQNKVPPKMIIFLDAWIFSDAVPHFRARESLPGYYEFLKEHNYQDQIPEVQRARYDRFTKTKTKDAILNLISFQETKESVTAFLAGRQNYLVKSYCTENNVIDSYLLWMGAHYSTKETKASDLDKIVADSENAKAFLIPWEKNHFLQQNFKDLIKDITAHNVELTIVTPLMQPTAYKVIADSDAFKNMHSLLDEIKGTNKLNICEVYEAEKAGCSEHEFKDSMHMTRECTRKLLRYCKLID